MTATSTRVTSARAVVALAVPACNKQPRREQTRDATEQVDRERSFELLEVTAGLLPRHVDAAPLLEKVACIPAVEHGKEPSCGNQRVYGDDNLYMLTGEATPSRHHLGELEPGTAAKLDELFAELCEGHVGPAVATGSC